MAKKEIGEGKYIGAFHYTSTSAERNLLNFFLSSVDNKEIVITMHCDIKDSPALGNKFMSVINSVRIEDEEHQSNSGTLRT